MALDPPAPIRAVLLDALGTLLELEAPAPLLRAELRERHGIELDEPAAWAALGAEIAYYRAHHDEASDFERLADLRLRCARVLRDALPPAAHGIAPAELLPALLASLRFRPFPEVPAALRALRAAGLGLVVVSNWDVSLHEALALSGLDPLLDGVVTSAELGAAKPDPAIFRHALQIVGVPADAALHVGDSVEGDVVGALAAGCGAVLVARTSSPPPVPAPARVVRGLDEVVELAT